MKLRDERMEILRIILARGESGNQDNILRELEQHGFKVTQATLSRDLRQLKAVKVPSANNNGYNYILPEHPHYRRSTKPSTMADYLVATGYRSTTFSGNLAIIHTNPGYAGGLASDIDGRHNPAIAGTVAGDDTILVIAAENVTRQQLIDALAESLPAIKRDYL